MSIIIQIVHNLTQRPRHLPHHLYADDSQLQVSFASSDSAAALSTLPLCLASVQPWMSAKTDKRGLFYVSEETEAESRQNRILPHREQTAEEHISLSLSLSLSLSVSS